MKQKQQPKEKKPIQVNNGFWDKPANERSQIMDKAFEYGGVSSFWGLSPEERAQAYDRD